MNAHPGGEAHTLRMLELACLPAGAKILDAGAGSGDAVALMRRLGFDAQGIDILPRSPLVQKGDLLHTGFASGQFDAVLSECAFFVSGDPAQALREAHRLLKPGGTLMLSDVFAQEPLPLLEKAGFSLLAAEDLTEQWKEYYIEALWREEEPCPCPRVKCTYWLLIGRNKKDGFI